MKANALLCRTDGSVEVLRDVDITAAFIQQTIGCSMFDLVRLAPSKVEPLERNHQVKLWNKRLSEEGAPVWLYLVCDDAGHLQHKPFNAIATELYGGGVWPIVGDVLIAEVP